MLSSMETILHYYAHNPYVCAAGMLASFLKGQCHWGMFSQRGNYRSHWSILRGPRHIVYAKSILTQKHISLWVHDYYGDRAQNRTGNKKQGLHMECLRPWGYSTRNTRGSYLHGQRKFKKMSPQGCKDIEWVSNLHSMCGHFFVSFTLHIIQHCKRHYVDMCTSTVFRVRCDYDDFFCWHFVHSVKTRHP